MQKKQFDALIDGKEANWASLSALSPNLKRNELSQQVKANEQPIPNEIRVKIGQFVDECRKKNMRERAIRRLVSRKFNITIVPDSK